MTDNNIVKLSNLVTADAALREELKQLNLNTRKLFDKITQHNAQCATFWAEHLNDVTTVIFEMRDGSKYKVAPKKATKSIYTFDAVFGFDLDNVNIEIISIKENE